MTAVSLTPDRFWLTRHYVALSTLASVVIAVASPGSLNARALEANGVMGFALLTVLAGVAMLLLVAAFTTAFVRGVQIDALRSRRHSLLMLLALGHLCMGFLIVTFAPVSAALVAPGHASGAAFVVNRADDLLADSTLRGKVSIVGPAYAISLDLELGFVAAL